MSRDTEAWTDDKRCVQLPLAHLTCAVLTTLPNVASCREFLRM